MRSVPCHMSKSFCHEGAHSSVNNNQGKRFCKLSRGTQSHLPFLESRFHTTFSQLLSQPFGLSFAQWRLLHCLHVQTHVTHCLLQSVCLLSLGCRSGCHAAWEILSVVLGIVCNAQALPRRPCDRTAFQASPVSGKCLRQRNA